MTDKYSKISPSHLHQLFEYNSETGVLVWRERINQPQWSGRYAGKEIRALAKGGYYVASIRSTGKSANYLVHRVAWAMYYGEWPSIDIEVDHINGIRTDNRIENLRLVTSSQNHKNTSKVKSKFGYKGVTKPPHQYRYLASICIDKRTVHLGYHATPIEAARAYDSMALATFGKFAKTNAMMGLL